jgi:hypothetical protein
MNCPTATFPVPCLPLASRLIDEGGFMISQAATLEIAIVSRATTDILKQSEQNNTFEKPPPEKQRTKHKKTHKKSKNEWMY